MVEWGGIEEVVGDRVVLRFDEVSREAGVRVGMEGDWDDCE